jgi:predicted CopG family antitoxin
MMNSRRYRVKFICINIGEDPTVPLAKTVKVHDDTHRVLKEIKAQRRDSSLDQVIRELIAKSTGTKVEGRKRGTGGNELDYYSMV